MHAPHLPLACSPDDPHCSVCGDVATEGQVVWLGAAGADAGTARVRFASGDAEVATDLIGEPLTVGDRVLVHLGFAIARLGGDAS